MVIDLVEHVLENMNEVISNDYSQEHQALDIISGDCSQCDIIALDSGIVEEVVKNVKYTDHSTSGLATYGNYVKIKQNNGKSALYAHMEYGSVHVNLGDYVEKGAIIGTMGQTGNAFGNHLHLEIKDQGGNSENPIVTLSTPSVNNQKNEIQDVNDDQSDSVTVDEVTKVENSNYSLPEKTSSDVKKTSKRSSKRRQIQDEYLNNITYSGGSIVDGLKEIGCDSSFDYREKLAIKNGITNYRGSYEQNVELLSLLKKGMLLKA